MAGLKWLGTDWLVAWELWYSRNKNEDDHGKMAVMINCLWSVVLFCKKYAKEFIQQKNYYKSLNGSKMGPGSTEILLFMWI